MSVWLIRRIERHKNANATRVSRRAAVCTCAAGCLVDVLLAKSEVMADADAKETMLTAFWDPSVGSELAECEAIAGARGGVLLGGGPRQAGAGLAVG